MIKYKEYFSRADINLIKDYTQRINNEKVNCDVGFYNLPFEFDSLKDKLLACKEYFKNKNHFVVIGMGGSSVGTKAITSFLGVESVDYLDNVSSIMFEKVCSRINISNTLFILVSKSGNTVESISYFRILMDRFGLSVGDLKECTIGICMQNTSLYEFLIENEIYHFNIEENVSGRFSVLSAVGIVPLYLAGVDVESLLDGAKACFNENDMNTHVLNLTPNVTCLNK